MEGNPTKPVRGMKDWGIQDYKKRKLALNIIEDQFEKHGFCGICLPAVEHAKLLNCQAVLDENGVVIGDNQKLGFNIMKRGSKLIDSINNICQQNLDGKDFGTLYETIEKLSEEGLKFDQTISLMRHHVDSHGKGKSSMKDTWAQKYYQIGDSWRAERPQEGRLRQFVQCDLDIIGAKNHHFGYELQILKAVSSVLKGLEINNTKLVINDISLTKNKIAQLGVPEDKMPHLLVLLDKKDKMPHEEFSHKVEQLLQKYQVNLTAQNLLENLESLTCVSEQDASGGIGNLIHQLTDKGKENQMNFANIEFNPYLVRGMHYYNSSVFELVQENSRLSIGGGGSYDALSPIMFKGADWKACGFSFGFDRLYISGLLDHLA